MELSEDCLRQLRIKTQSLTRILSDCQYAARELDTERKRLSLLRAPEGDEEELVARQNQQRRVISESEMMISDSSLRLQQAQDDLSLFLDTIGVGEGKNSINTLSQGKKDTDSMEAVHKAKECLQLVENYGLKLEH
mmetsp:Transcript_32639/g.44821  ORF Transcript_32639/g.44821 Transcript_32639/m.44821 type:complete len:136 (+) Transcript_32639:55-462(+)|eukprot:CAMPEP_0201494216 /NCGR_PEP_ID=MMETSP0151_2-20130828/46035_1 /ASSEMBLY_ACC=CAM_ASM_000257 /TAXON_ID=200890 /ORGANISM="Paramoeba atlantica, Strain 621/1 / CCAP 1560/9" /LENGTH=135 /DNA_ID=CAMNT_0047882311 /DNA_START=50 /DNA_END=457 /DNA_ORIENTATION=-